MSSDGPTTSSSDTSSEQRAERAVRSSEIPNLRDEDESPGNRFGGDGSSESSSADRVVALPTSSARPDKRVIRTKKQRSERRLQEYFQSDNNAGIFPSWCTEESIRQTRSACRIPDCVKIIIPKISDRPWDCPEGYVCLYESYFRSGRLWFPLPDLLVRYCRERRIAISQLTCSSIINLIGLILLGEELGIQVTLRFLEETCMIKKTRGRERVFYLSAKTKHNLITQEKGQNVKQWERFYFFVKIDDFTSFSSSSSFFRRWATCYG